MKEPSGPLVGGPTSGAQTLPPPPGHQRRPGPVTTRGRRRRVLRTRSTGPTHRSPTGHVTGVTAPPSSPSTEQTSTPSATRHSTCSSCPPSRSWVAPRVTRDGRVGGERVHTTRGVRLETVAGVISWEGDTRTSTSVSVVSHRFPDPRPLLHSRRRPPSVTPRGHTPADRESRSGVGFSDNRLGRLLTPKIEEGGLTNVQREASNGRLPEPTFSRPLMVVAH